jgi:uracil-DNA glycosylase family 4
MTQQLPEALRAKIKQRLGFYEDLGLAPFYRARSAGTQRKLDSTIAAPAISYEEAPLPKRSSTSVVGVQHVAPDLGKIAAAQLGASLASRQSEAILQPPARSFFASLKRIENDSLLKIREDIGDCKRCKLHKKRKHIVFADGNPNADLVFVGEGPGADEDATGIPFVGRAGKLLTQMIEAMGLQRKDVYICNVVKCRPPENRQPEPDEVTTCSPYLVRQLEVVNPKVIVCLGATAAQTILETTQGISRFRGQWQDFRGKKLLATYHPAYLLRNPAAKADVWKDLQKVMAELGLEVKKKPA